jgi:hypothetical protein
VLLLATVLAGLTPGIRTPTGNIDCFVSHRVSTAQSAALPTTRAAPTSTCVSQLVGLSCRNLAGHSLFVSRDSWSRR